MTSRFIKAGLAVAAAGCALALGTGSAAAATTYTVTAGSAPTGTTFKIKGTTQGASPQIAFTDTTSGTELNCVSGTASGSSKTGTGLAGTKIGTISATTWNGCTGPLGLEFVVTQSGTWSINAKYKTSTGATGNISNISAVVDGGSACKFTVTGSVPIKFTNKSSRSVLTVTTTSAGTLTVSNLTGGCFGAVNNGDKATFSGAYVLSAVNSVYNPVKIT